MSIHPSEARWDTGILPDLKKKSGNYLLIDRTRAAAVTPREPHQIKIKILPHPPSARRCATGTGAGARRVRPEGVILIRGGPRAGTKQALSVSLAWLGLGLGSK
jgi:hypothetical protein